jgi:hypothetical protein
MARSLLAGKAVAGIVNAVDRHHRAFPPFAVRTERPARAHRRVGILPRWMGAPSDRSGRRRVVGRAVPKTPLPVEKSAPVATATLKYVATPRFE